MQVGSARIEVIRFSLLVVLTIGLLSVAFRIDSHSSSHSGAAPHSSPSSPSQVLPTASTRAPSPTHSPTATPSTHGTGGAGTGGGNSGNGGAAGGAGGTAQLPATGWQGAVRLSALSLVLIGGGVMAMRVAGPRTRR